MNSLNGSMVVGLTGQTGSGKTTVCKVFEDNGFKIINADLIAREVMQKGSPCLEELSMSFKEKIVDNSGMLDRKLMGSIVFADKDKLDLMNSICNPYITEEILRLIREYADGGHKLILLDAPTLFESRADDFCELVISVIARENNRLSRIMSRDSIDKEMALKRMSSQKCEEFFKNNSDFIIKNNKSMQNLYDITQEVSDKIKVYYNTKYNI